jgi:hypothetical protein
VRFRPENQIPGKKELGNAAPKCLFECLHHQSWRFELSGEERWQAQRLLWTERQCPELSRGWYVLLLNHPFSTSPADTISRPPKIPISLQPLNSRHHLPSSLQPSRLLPYAPLHGLNREHEQRPCLCFKTYVTRSAAGTRFISPFVTSAPMFAWPWQGPSTSCF